MRENDRYINQDHNDIYGNHHLNGANMSMSNTSTLPFGGGSGGGGGVNGISNGMTGSGVHLTNGHTGTCNLIKFIFTFNSFVRFENKIKVFFVSRNYPLFY